MKPGAGELHLGPLLRSQGSKELGHFSYFLQTHYQGIEFQMEDLGLDVALLWDVGIAGGGLTHCEGVF